MTRHPLRHLLACVALFPGLLTATHAEAAGRTPNAKPINVVLITVDDMNCDSVGVYGCPIPNITPHIDRLASQGHTVTFFVTAGTTRDAQVAAAAELRGKVAPCCCAPRE